MNIFTVHSHWGCSLVLLFYMEVFYQIWVIFEEWRYRSWVSGWVIFLTSYEVIWTQNQYVSDLLSFVVKFFLPCLVSMMVYDDTRTKICHYSLTDQPTTTNYSAHLCTMTYHIIFYPCPCCLIAHIPIKPKPCHEWHQSKFPFSNT